MEHHRTVVAGDDIPTRVQKIIMDHLGVEAAQVTPETRLSPPDGEGHEAGDGHLGCDSLDIVELTMAVEEEFGIEITDDESDKLTSATVEDVHKLIALKAA